MYIDKNPNLAKGNLIKFDKFIKFIVLSNIMTVVAIDRLIHHASIYQIEGESYHKKLNKNRTK